MDKAEKRRMRDLIKNIPIPEDIDELRRYRLTIKIISDIMESDRIIEKHCKVTYGEKLKLKYLIKKDIFARHVKNLNDKIIKKREKIEENALNFKEKIKNSSVKKKIRKWIRCRKIEYKFLKDGIKRRVNNIKKRFKK